MHKVISVVALAVTVRICKVGICGLQTYHETTLKRATTV